MQRRSLIVLTGLIVSTVAFAAGDVEPGFTSLFDGKTLNGWKLLAKSGEGYLVQGGMIVCPPKGGGNLFYDKEFSDFVLRFEFQLEDGSNNGLAIRAPMQEGNIAYDGIELQIIDDSSERYKKIEPWQKHGSLYHVFPAKEGALKKVGEWNEQEVTVKGTTVKVVLNGKTILDVDKATVKGPEILKKHPGLMRPSGYIGFLGHNEPIKFRRIRIKEL
jgi:hypothetical protein